MVALPETIPSRAQQRRNADCTCVFCDEHITPGTPAEHVIPDWIRRLRAAGTVYQHKSKHPGVLTHRSKRIDITAKTVCRECNHGWMSDLETKASPILKPMIEGRSQGMSVEQQVLLSQWATKTAFMLELHGHPAQPLPALAAAFGTITFVLAISAALFAVVGLIVMSRSRAMTAPAGQMR